MVMEAIFLDTTVQCLRTFADHQVREAIRRVLVGEQLITSDYVLGEYNATFLIDCMALYDLLLHNTPDQTLLQMLRYRHSRRLQRMIQVLAHVMRMLERRDKTFTRQNALPILQHLIEYDLPFRFWYGVTYMILDVCCRRAKYVRPQRSERGYGIQEQITCRKQEQQKRQDCRIVPFWQMAKDSLIAIQLANLPEHLSDMQRVAAKILDEPSEAYGVQNCSKMGDTIILLEVPDRVPVCSTNERDFAPLAELLGKDFVNPTKQAMEVSPVVRR